MLRITTAILSLSLLVSAAAAVEDQSTAANKEFKSLVNEYEEAGGAGIFAKRFLKLAEKHRQDPVAMDALLWVISKVPNRPESTQALRQLAKHHLDSEQLAEACASIVRVRSTAAEDLLRVALEKSPHKTVRAQACLHLAALLEAQASVIDQLKQQPELAPRVLQYYGQEYGKYLATRDADKLSEQREQVYERMLETFPDVKVQDIALGDVAEKALFRIRHLSVGKLAPETKGEDIHGQEFKLSDYRGRIVMLTFWGHW